FRPSAAPIVRSTAYPDRVPSLSSCPAVLGPCDGTGFPLPSDVAHECGVDDEMAERLDEQHVDLAKSAAGLDVHAHLRAITTSTLLEPCKVQNAVHGAI